jgi:hypothetical protein
MNGHTKVSRSRTITIMCGWLSWLRWEIIRVTAAKFVIRTLGSARVPQVKLAVHMQELHRDKSTAVCRLRKSHVLHSAFGLSQGRGSVPQCRGLEHVQHTC